jgi:hypothetical protein
MRGCLVVFAGGDKHIAKALLNDRRKGIGFFRQAHLAHRFVHTA